jgi:hypothetical protein
MGSSKPRISVAPAGEGEPLAGDELADGGGHEELGASEFDRSGQMWDANSAMPGRF